MPGWQRYYEQTRSDDVELVAVALEHGGRELARPFVEAANAAFPAVADEHGVLSRLLGFKAVPNGVLIDEEGTVVWTKFGGFSVERAEDVAAVDAFRAGEPIAAAPEPSAPYALDALTRELIETKLRLGRLLDETGRRAEAVAAWRDALRLDPENLTIRKQIWAAEQLEKFHPTIDFDWQKAQLRAEREREIAEGICGPDGCPVPWTT